MHEHSYTHTHTYTHTHIHACTQDTRMHGSVRSRALTHTKCSFVIGHQSLWNHLPDTVKEAGSNSLSRYLKRSYLVIFRNTGIFLIVTVPSTLFDLFVAKNKMILNFQPHRTTLLCLHVYNVWNALRSIKFTCDYLAKNAPSSHFTRSGIIAPHP